MVTYSSCVLVQCWLPLRILAKSLTGLSFIFVPLAIYLLQDTGARGDAGGGWTVKNQYSVRINSLFLFTVSKLCLFRSIKIICMKFLVCICVTFQEFFQLCDNYNYIARYFLFQTAVFFLIYDLFTHIITNYFQRRTDKNVCIRTVQTQTNFCPKQ